MFGCSGAVHCSPPSVESLRRQQAFLCRRRTVNPACLLFFVTLITQKLYWPDSYTKGRTSKYFRHIQMHTGCPSVRFLGDQQYTLPCCSHLPGPSYCPLSSPATDKVGKDSAQRYGHSSPRLTVKGLNVQTFALRPYNRASVACYLF